MSRRKDFHGMAVEQPDEVKADESVRADARRMAREVKIGVGVIALLLVIFAIALYHRLSGSPDDSLAAAAEDTSQWSPTPTASRAAAAESATTTQPATAVIRAKPGTLTGDGSSGPAATAAAAATPRSEAADATPLPTLSYMPPQSEWQAGQEAAGADQSSPALTAGSGGAWSESAAQVPDQAAMQAVPHSMQQAVSSSGAPAAGSSSAADVPSSWALGAQGFPSASGSSAEQSLGAGSTTAAPPVYAQQAGSAISQAPAAAPYSTFKAPEPPETPQTASAYQGPYQSAATDTSWEAGGTAGQGEGPTADGKYIVQPNDNYWVISEKVYGTGAFFRALAEHNRHLQPDPNHLELGAEIEVPPIEELQKRYADLCPRPEHRLAASRHQSVMRTASQAGGGRVYVVQPGDTLFDIARHELGKASRYAEIIQLNRDVLAGQYDYLTPGMKLILPADDNPAAGPVTQRPQEAYQR